MKFCNKMAIKSRLENKPVLLVLGWLIGAIFIIFGVMKFIESILGGVLIIIGALIIFPPFWRLLKKFNIVMPAWLKAILFIILVSIGLMMS